MPKRQTSLKVEHRSKRTKPSPTNIRSRLELSAYDLWAVVNNNASIIHVPHQGCRLHDRDKASRLRNSGHQGDANGSHHRDEQGVIEYREPCRQSRVKDRPRADRPRAQSSETRQRHILCLGAPQGHEPNEALLEPNQVRSACQSRCRPTSSTQRIRESSANAVRRQSRTTRTPSAGTTSFIHRMIKERNLDGTYFGF